MGMWVKLVMVSVWLVNFNNFSGIVIFLVFIVDYEKYFFFWLLSFVNSIFSVGFIFLNNVSIYIVMLVRVMVVWVGSIKKLNGNSISSKVRLE